MTFDMGHDGFPAICMTQFAAKMYCKWLSAKTGHYYRLPTEAEWEYACRAGTKTAYSFGDDPTQMGDYAWYEKNAKEKYHKVGLKKPNPWGLYDMHGNVAEWTLDQYNADFYAADGQENAAGARTVGSADEGVWPGGPRRLVGRRGGPSPQRGPHVFDSRVEDSGSADSAKYLVLYRRQTRRFSRHPPVARPRPGRTRPPEPGTFAERFVKRIKERESTKSE